VFGPNPAACPLLGGVFHGENGNVLLTSVAIVNDSKIIIIDNFYVTKIIYIIEIKTHDGFVFDGKHVII